jgi:hypothetical protein
MERANLEPITGSQGKSRASIDALEGSRAPIATPRVIRAEKKDKGLAASEERIAKLTAPVMSGSKMSIAEIIELLYQ